jgi:hypothetical protein
MSADSWLVLLLAFVLAVLIPIRSQRHTSQRQQLSIQQLEYEKPKKAA